MLSTFRMDPAASVRRLFDIRVTKITCQKIEKSLHDKNRYLGYSDSNRYIFAVLGLPNFLTSNLVTLNNTLQISHSLRPLATGTIKLQNAEDIESPNYRLTWCWIRPRISVLVNSR